MKSKALLYSIMLSFFSFGVLRAGHIVGGEVTYVCRGFLNDAPSTNIKVYDVKINAYRDCVGRAAWFDGDPSGFGPPPENERSVEGHITVYRGTTLEIPTLEITMERDQVNLVPVDVGNPCLTVTEEICQQIGVYAFTLELEVSDEPYTITYQRCCRNGEINNLVDPSEIGITYFIDISPEAQQRCNGSPEFNSDPPIAFCLNEPFQIDMGATDREGDSLVYKLCSGVLGGGIQEAEGTTGNPLYPEIESPPPYEAASFRSPQFDVLNQLGRGSSLNINPETGLLVGEPIFRGIYSLAVCVEEWSRGPSPILLSETKREFQLGVNLCENQLNGDLLETSLDADGRFFIRQCELGEFTIINESTNVDFINSYSWSLEGPAGTITGRDRDFTTEITVPGTYEGIMVLNEEASAENCIDTAFFAVGVFPEVRADFSFVEPGCDDEPIDFTDLSTVGAPSTIVSWEWEFSQDSDPLSVRNPQYRYLTPGEFPVGLRVMDNNGCTADTLKTVTYFPSPRTLLVEPAEDFGCAPFTKGFVNLSRPVNEAYIFNWEFGDGGTSGEQNPSHLYESVGLYDVYLSITSPTGCFGDTVFQNLVDVRTVPMADFEWTPAEPTNLMPDFRIVDRSVEANRFRYFLRDRTGRQLFSTQLADFDYTLRDSSTLTITQVVTHPGGCSDTIIRDIRQKLVNTFFMPDAFTPNGDGLNDFFLPVGVLTGITNYRMRIWNRWGELLFSTNELKSGWDGSSNGTNSPGGSYFWDAQYIDVGGEFQEVKGGVVLFR